MCQASGRNSATTCTATPGGSSAIPATEPPKRIPWREARIAAIRRETPRVVTLALDAPGWPGHRPGQHVDVRLTAEDGYQAQRSYSIASGPEDGRLALTVERIDDGEVSPYLTGVLQEGDEIELRGPIGGHFVWTPPAQAPLLLVAGGSGIVPLMAMLRRRSAGGHSGPAVLIYSSRSEEDVIYRGELEDMAAADPTLRVVHTLTRVQPVGWAGPARRIDAAMLDAEGVRLLPAPDAFVCGPSGMVEAASCALVALGVPPERIRTERFGPT
jgi:ferredoxin-NADP reductase